jgi:glycerol-3-phosphate dehydrogenase
MWDDVLAVETLRAAQLAGAAVANYVEAVGPLWTGDRISGFRVRDLERTTGDGEINLKAHKTIVCAGPWTDAIGITLSAKWHRWLNTSKGVHLIFDLKRIPVPGAMVMTNPSDGRISFVIPRPDFGAGVAIVGTTDGPTPDDPEKAIVEKSDVDYLMGLLNRYFPGLALKSSDILSAYVGVRPLMGDGKEVSPNEVSPNEEAPHERTPAIGAPSASVLQKVSREHHIDHGPGGTVIVAGGKYTTHRRMAEEIVEFALKQWKHDAAERRGPEFPVQLRGSGTLAPVNPKATLEAISQARVKASAAGLKLPEELFARYGAEALEVAALEQQHARVPAPASAPDGDPDGFPMLQSQLRYAIRTGMVVHLEDFYIRRLPLYLSRADRSLPWAETLARVWAEERGLPLEAIPAELERLRAELERRSSWQLTL